MRKLITIAVALIMGHFSSAQLVEDDILQQEWHTHNTSSVNMGKWTRIATCTNYGGYADFGTIFELFGNGGGNGTFYYGRLIVRIKRQHRDAGPATHMALTLLDSNIGVNNIRGVRNGSTLDVYIKINNSYTRYHFRRSIRAGATITALNDQPFLEELPTGDYILDCQDGDLSKNAENSFTVSGDNNQKFHVNSTNSSSDSKSLIKASYNYNETAKYRSAKLELGSVHNEGDGGYYNKVWSFESFSTNTWANAPRFRISRGEEDMLNIGYYGEVGIGKVASTNTKLDVAGTIRAEEILVEAQTADFVFEPDYNLKDLAEVEVFIKTNKHLPDIPSASEMEEQGVNLAEMNKLLLQKVEELTLYAIEKDKRIEKLNEALSIEQSARSKMAEGMSSMKEELQAIKALITNNILK